MTATLPALSAWRIDKGNNENVIMIAETKKITDLWRHAWDWYALDKEKAKAILKEAGHTTFVRANWFEYLDILRKHWPHTIELLHEEAIVEDKMRTLCKLADECVRDETDPSAWKWTGTPEQLAAKWKLQNIEREERLKKWRSYGSCR